MQITDAWVQPLGYSNVAAYNAAWPRSPLDNTTAFTPIWRLEAVYALKGKALPASLQGALAGEGTPPAFSDVSMLELNDYAKATGFSGFGDISAICPTCQSQHDTAAYLIQIMQANNVPVPLELMLFVISGKPAPNDHSSSGKSDNSPLIPALMAAAAIKKFFF